MANDPRTSGAVYLDACPPPYQTPDIHSIPGVLTVRPVPFDGPPSVVPQWLVNLPRPAAYVTFGTVPAFSRPELLRAAVEAVEPLVASVVVTTGPNPPDDLHLGSPRVHVASYLAQSDVFPRVDLVVSHGGAGTTLGAITHGVPHLVMPGFAPSQQRNAARTQQLGVGLCITQGTPATQLREAAHRLLTDDASRAAAAAASRSLDRLPSVEDCVDLLEDVAGPGQ
jgi:UDP:flavonoid glycosyltransferase YjiC (YdhE family)